MERHPSTATNADENVTSLTEVITIICTTDNFFISFSVTLQDSCQQKPYVTPPAYPYYANLAKTHCYKSLL